MPKVWFKRPRGRATILSASYALIGFWLLHF